MKRRIDLNYPIYEVLTLFTEKTIIITVLPTLGKIFKLVCPENLVLVFPEVFLQIQYSITSVIQK
jgi:hypothetical protein